MCSSESSFMQIKILIMTPVTRTINFIKQAQRFELALYQANESDICDPCCDLKFVSRINLQVDLQL